MRTVGSLVGNEAVVLAASIVLGFPDRIEPTK
jgi:hypothetical protein